MPPKTLLLSPASAPPAAGWAASRTGQSTIAHTRATAANTAITAPGPPTPMTMPAVSGPPTVPTPSLQLETTFAAVSSAGVRATLGSSADCVGRTIVNGTAATIAATYTAAGGAPASMTAAVTAMPSAMAT